MLTARALCLRCRRPQSVCWCAQVPRLQTRTRVVLLQHPREHKMAIGTARMAHLALPNSVVHVGLRFDGDPKVRAELAAGPPAHLLFPGEQALDVRALPQGAPLTLVVVDGTWAQARNLIRHNRELAALPRIAFSPARLSEYRIRRQPDHLCVSTIEALAEVLQVLEPEGGPFERLLEPFRAMVERQLWFKNEVRSCRHRTRERRPARPQAPSLGQRLAADWNRLVCLVGDANAWPVRTPGRPEPEIVHLVACRPASGELHEAVLAPRTPMSPSTPSHLELLAERFLAGLDLSTWRRSWLSFSRPDDLLVQWGTFHSALADADGLTLPAQRLDLRSQLAQSHRQRAGTVEQGAAQLRATVEPLAVSGRAGRRLSALVSLVRALRANAS